MRNFCADANPARLTCAPKYELHNVQNGRRHLIMQYLDEDLEDYIVRQPEGEVRDRAIQKMAVQMLEKIKEMHRVTQHIHRDIKPPNFRVHQDRLYVTDFGLAQEYMKDRFHIQETKNEPIQGTLRYASHWTHEGITQSRRDDIEMIAYSILKLLGKDPKAELWSHVNID